MNSDLKYEKINIELRRGKVLELLAKGYSQRQIAQTLNVSDSLVSIDIQRIRESAKEELRTHIQEVIPFEYQKSKQAILDLIKKANEILEKNSEDPKLQLSVINVLTNLWMANSNINSQGDIIQQAYDKVSTLEEIQKRRSDNEEAVFSEEDIKEDIEPANTKITTIDDQDRAPEPEEDIEKE